VQAAQDACEADRQTPADKMAGAALVLAHGLGRPHLCHWLVV